MADLKYYDIILKPVITEKSMAAMEEKKYTFLVHTDATKNQIKEAMWQNQIKKQAEKEVLVCQKMHQTEGHCSTV